MAMHKRPEVEDVGAVERSSVSVKMVGNITELKKPIASAAHPAIAPGVSPPACVTTRHSRSATAAANASRRSARTRISTRLPSARPTIALPQ